MLWALISAGEWKDFAWTTQGPREEAVKLAGFTPKWWLHFFMVFCALSSWETLDLPACLQILMHPSTGGWMKGRESWGTILCCGQRKKGRAAILQTGSTQSGLNSCTFSSFHSAPDLPWWYVFKKPHNFTLSLVLLLYGVSSLFLLSQHSPSFLTTCTLATLQLPYPFAHIPVLHPPCSIFPF